MGYDKHENCAPQLMANGETAAYVRGRMGIRASKSRAIEKARGKSEVDVSKTLAIEVQGKPKPDAGN